MVEVADQVSSAGEYRPPVRNPSTFPDVALPPHTIISASAHTAVWSVRATGELAPVEVGSHESPEGLYRPPVFVYVVANPPQTIISAPVHTAVCPSRAEGALASANIGS